jgi:nucleoid-associated protein YgaU
MKNSTCIRRAVVTLGVVVIGLGNLVGTASGQSYDVAGGQYLTEEEYKKLSKDEALDYCQKLAQEIDIQNDNAAAANAMMSDIDAEIRRLKRELSLAKDRNDPLENEIRDLQRQLRQMEQLPRSYTVVKDDWLIKISAKPRIYGNETHWKRIYRGNREKIDDPNLIYPDQIFLIPRGTPTTHMVAEGETLRRIAGYWEIYGDRSQWERIYDANRDQISDPDIVQPGMVLTIPR